MYSGMMLMSAPACMAAHVTSRGPMESLRSTGTPAASMACAYISATSADS